MLIYVDYNKDKAKWNVYYNDTQQVCHYIKSTIPPEFEILIEGGQYRGKVLFNGLVSILDDNGIITVQIDKCV